ncbi:MAG TPA: ComEC/Rec2 family competence protein, partial [Solirubrobacteraceae bacterium]|nr:ComEC/Rec2 family competence protein [Solirubrobacteraceae bacterium]
LGGLARGMVLGEDAALPEGLGDDFRAAGLSHLLAASGANVALLAALVLGLCALLGVPLAARLTVALTAIAAYVPLAGGGPSIQRAGVMGAAAIVAALASAAPSRWYALLLAAAATLAANPRAAEDPGWQLSFVAVIALLALAPALRARLGRRLPDALADVVAIALAAGVATAPLIALRFGQVSLVSLPANLLAAPAVAPVMWLGALAAAAGQASPALAQPLTALAAWPLAFLAWLGHAAASVPGAQAAVHVSPAATVGVYAVLVCAVGCERHLMRAFRSPRVRAVVDLRGTAAVAALVALAIATAVAVAALRGRAPGPPPGLVVSALDVGQGDATLLQHGGHAILVDTGPPGAPLVPELRAAGVRRLDLLVVTHAQADHEGGAAAVLAALPVGLVLDGRDGNPSADGDRFAAVARRRGVPMLAPDAGQELRAGPLALDVLSPRREDLAAHAGEDPNRRAIVAELRDGGFSMLLTADAESDVLAALPLEPVDVLKVSHHGSDDPGLPALLGRLRPRLALIEVGRHNDYGHPAASTLAALRADGVAEVLRTDRDGTVRVHVRGARLAVERHA